MVVWDELELHSVKEKQQLLFSTSRNSFLQDAEKTIPEIRVVEAGGATGAIIGALIGIIILLAIIGTAVFLIRRQRRNKDSDAPPTHKPPPPMKISDRNMEPKVTMNPLIPGSNESPLMYYETQKTEPMTDLDSYHDEYDEEPEELPVNHSAPSCYHESELDDVPDEDVNDDAGQLTPSVSRVDSFVSPAVIV